MSNSSLITIVKNSDNSNLIDLYNNTKNEIDYYLKKLNTSLEQDKEYRYIEVKLNELKYLFTLENLKYIVCEINKRGILI